MLLHILKNFTILIMSVVLSVQAFWWNNPTTESPTATLKQIPVGYFRTYTYHPLGYPGSYSSYSYIGSHQSMASPFLAWSQRQTASLTNSAPAPLSGLHIPPGAAALTLKASTSKPQSLPSSTLKSSGSITTTSSPPLPSSSPIHYVVTNPSTIITSTTEQQSQTENSATLNERNQQQQQHQLQQHPQDYMGVPRPLYSSPDPFPYQYPGSSAQPLQQVQFVPCMCPVTVSVSEMPDGRSTFDNENFNEQNDLFLSKDDIH